MIEYAGEMVRPTVADQREAGSYNQLVGAGTYVFCLDDDFMVDATKAGNMAHLLNHSCQPNCYSKHVHVWDENLGVKVPHVVICAKQAIPVREELTYDYRYAFIIFTKWTDAYYTDCALWFRMRGSMVCCITRLHKCNFVEPSKGVQSVERGGMCCAALKWRQVWQAQPDTANSVAANGYVLGHATARQHTEGLLGF